MIGIGLLISAIALLCWTQSSLGLVPLSGRPASLVKNPGITLRYSDALVEEEREQLKSRLPPIDRRTMSKLEIEFRELLQAMLFTPQEMSCITNPRLRTIYEGVVASYWEPAVYRAFEVLYEDYAPLRVAGRIIHRKLQDIMNESKQYQQYQLRRVVQKTGFDLENVAKCWESFVGLAGDRELSGDVVTFLVRRGQALNILSERTTENDVDLVGKRDGRTKLSFEDVIDVFLQHSSSSDLTIEGLMELFQLDDTEHVISSSKSCLNEKQLKYSRRYDDMLEKFGEWKSFIPSGEGRRLDILKGCFVGSENPQVVEALRVIYTDYSALRLSGDWIFQVVSTIMNATMKRRRNSSP